MGWLSKGQIERELRERIEARTRSMSWRPGYESWVEGRIQQEHSQTPTIDNLRSYFGAELENLSILEIGSGMGGLLVRLQQEGLKAFGLDYCTDYCVISKIRGMRYGIGTPIFNAQAERIPLRDQSVDVILCYEVFEHVFDPVTLLQELRRVVRPNGVVFITVPNRWALYDHHYHLWGVNLLPRRLAEVIIRRTGRDKGVDRSAGVQLLHEMHYVPFTKLVTMCKREGFNPYDVREEKLAKASFSRKNKINCIMIHLLRKTGLLHIAYSLYRSTVMDEFHLRLVPSHSLERTIGGE